MSRMSGISVGKTVTLKTPVVAFAECRTKHRTMKRVRLAMRNPVSLLQGLREEEIGQALAALDARNAREGVDPLAQRSTK
jgi:hypothetical protein